MKKTYIVPETDIIEVLTESLLETASPGDGKPYDPEQGIDARTDMGFIFDDYEGNGENSQSSTISLWDD